MDSEKGWQQLLESVLNHPHDALSMRFSGPDHATVQGLYLEQSDTCAHATARSNQVLTRRFISVISLGLNSDSEQLSGETVRPT